jgi:heptosyltransferase III
MRRLLLLRPGGLGDLLVTLPSARLLRRFDPQAEFSLAARPAYAAVFAAAGLVDRVLDLDDRVWAPLFSGSTAGPLPGGPFSELWAWFLHPPPDSLTPAAAAGTLGGAHFIVADTASGLPLRRDFFLRTAAAAGIAAGEDEFAACSLLPRREPTHDLPFSGPFAVVHPGSGGRRKRWPADRFLSLVGLLAGRGLPGLLITGPAEEEDVFPTGAPLPPGWRRVHSPPLEDLASWLAACRLYIGNDSGVTHLAAAAGAPALAFFLEENLPAWEPGGRVTVLTAPRLEDISLADVRVAVFSILGD